MPRSPASRRKQADGVALARRSEAVPADNVEVLKDTLGVDVARMSAAQVQEVAVALSRSMSASPYSSAEMMQEYRDRGFPDLPDKIVRSIDLQTAHRQGLESLVTKGGERRKDRAQWGAQAVAVTGLVGALVAGYLGVPSAVRVAAIVVAIGGPNAATILGRVLDRNSR